ncbi:response regulator transcription factor ArlR [Clostridia bacterium]|nr:response regulator transcription factor ArlR [Clostridia bacterium]
MLTCATINLMKILVCEDEPSLSRWLLDELTHAGYAAESAADGDTALELFGQNRYDLVLLDLMLPKKSGLEVLREIRSAAETPVFVLTARRDTHDKVLLLKSGADDYITKPFDMLELLARIERRLSARRTANLRGLRLDEAASAASLNGKPLSLTATEFSILCELAENADTVVSREKLLWKLYGQRGEDSNVIDVNVKNIRRKIAAITDESYIDTVRGKGYVIRDETL